jgi:hypothetical protein
MAGQNLNRREERLLRRSHRVYSGAALLLLLFLVAVNVGGLLQKDRTYSENENRMLAQKPVFHIAASTTYMQEIEDYVADQFFLRDVWIGIKYMADKVLGKKESNGVYLGKDGYLMEVPNVPDEGQLARTTDAITEFADEHENLHMVMTLIPNASTVCSQYLPTNAPARDQREDIRTVSEAVSGHVEFCDVTDALESHKKENLYYRTDHHWTSLGAKYAFEELKTPLGISDEGIEYKAYPVTDDFAGTLAAKVGFHEVEDNIEIYVPQIDNLEYVVDYVGDRKTGSIYDSEALDQKDKYEVFFGGNYARIDIHTLQDGKNLLLLKDSYANCFVQFLLPYYKNITIIDPRYYEDDINQLIETNGITDVLFLYNVNTFEEDHSLADVLEG